MNFTRASPSCFGAKDSVRGQRDCHEGKGMVSFSCCLKRRAAQSRGFQAKPGRNSTARALGDDVCEYLHGLEAAMGLDDPYR
jgi:hypothetical protein